jgi:ribonuclease E
MANKMLIDASHAEETRVAVVRGNRVEEFDFESAQRKQIRGNIYLAKVTRVEPSLQAAFVDYGGNRHGFLAFGEIHPDYYQIPVADRQALIEEEARLAAERSDSDDRGPRGGRGRGRRRGRDRNDNTNNDRGESNENGSEASEAQSASLSAENESPIESVSSSEQETTETLTQDETSLANDGQSQEAAQNNDEGASESAESPLESDGSPEEESVEALGGSDAMEELSDRPRRYAPRRYKIQEVIKRRQVILVQVVKEERGTKGAALTTYLSLAGRYSVLMPNTARGGGISRKISNAVDRTRLKEIAQELDVPEGMGVIVRTAGATRTKPEIKRDYEYLMRLWESVAELTLKSQAPALVYEEGSLIKRAIRDLYNKEIDEVLVAGEHAYEEAKDFMRMLMPSHTKNIILYNDNVPLFSRHGVETQLEQMFQSQVHLRSGGYIVINQAEALVAIDVNSGRSTREHNIEDTALRTNLEAAEEISRQLRLRDLAGLIVIDFIDMEEHRNNRSVERKLKDCLRHDRARIQVGRISHFGLLEMSRQRLRASVFESTTETCPVCNGAGHVRSPASTALQILRLIEEKLMQDNSHNLIVRTRIQVALYVLNQKRAHLRGLEERFGVMIQINADDHLPAGSSYLLERGSSASAPILPAKSGVKVDSVNVSDIEIAEEEEEEEALQNSSGDAVEPPASEDIEGKRFRHRGRRKRRGRDREGYSSRESRNDVAPGESERGESEGAPSAQAESTDEQPGVRHANNARSQRMPRRKLRTPANEEKEETSSHQSQAEISGKNEFDKRASSQRESDDDDAPRPLPRVPDLPELKEADQPKSKGGGKAGWWSKKLIGG